MFLGGLCPWGLAVARASAGLSKNVNATCAHAGMFYLPTRGRLYTSVRSQPMPRATIILLLPGGMRAGLETEFCAANAAPRGKFQGAGQGLGTRLIGKV